MEKQIGTRCVLRWIIIQYGRGLVLPGNYLVNSDRTGWDIIANTVIIIITEIIIARILLKLLCKKVLRSIKVGTVVGESEKLKLASKPRLRSMPALPEIANREVPAKVLLGNNRN